MPEVGLELHSSPCKHWELPETCGIRPDPTDVRPSPTPNVWTLSTPPILSIKGHTPTAAPRIDGVRRFFVLRRLMLPQSPRTAAKALMPRSLRDACTSHAALLILCVFTAASTSLQPFMVRSADSCLTAASTWRRLRAATSWSAGSGGIRRPKSFQPRQTAEGLAALGHGTLSNP